MFDADDALLRVPVPGHPGNRASVAHPVQEADGRRGGAERAVQLLLSLFLLATRVAGGRRVLVVMAVCILPSKMKPSGKVETTFHLEKHHGTLKQREEVERKKVRQRRETA